MTFKNTKFKKIITAFAFAALSLMLPSCDNIDETERYLRIDPVKAERVVLLEDFTGQNCVNCPDAHTVIEGLQAQYGDNVLAVSIHGGAFSISRDKTSFDAGYIGLGTPEGEYYNTLFNISSWPKGVINRRGGVVDYTDWATVVRSEIEKPADVTINLDVALSADDASKESLNINVEIIPHADIENCNLQVWILESGIVARQRSASKGLMNNYVHNNVLRAAVNGNDGDKMELRQGLHNNSSYSIELRNNEQERWEAENLTVVAFVKSESGVHQTAFVRISEKN